MSLKQFAEHFGVLTAKANLLDIIIAGGCITQATLDKCIDQLDDIDQIIIREENNG